MDLSKSGRPKCAMSDNNSDNSEQAELRMEADNSKFAASRADKTKPRHARPCSGGGGPG